MRVLVEEIGEKMLMRRSTLHLLREKRREKLSEDKDRAPQ